MDRNTAVRRSERIVDQIRSSLTKIMTLNTVYKIDSSNATSYSGNLKNDENSGKDVFKAQGGYADRSGFGRVVLGKKGAVSTIFHGNGPAKQAAFPAIKSVIEQGIEIGRDYNHNGKGFDTVTFAAPVDFFGTKAPLGVVVKVSINGRGDKSFYIHEICDAEGNYIQLEDGTPSKKEISNTGLVDSSSTAGAADNGISPKSSIRNDGENVNKKFSDRAARNTDQDGGVQYSQRYLAANTNSEILSMVNKVSNGEFKANEKVYLGTVSDAIANQIHALTGIRVNGFKVAIEARQIEHILKDHGTNGASDHSMANPGDIAKMEYVLSSPDDIRKAGKTQAYLYMRDGKNRHADTVLYEKNIGTQSYYVVQAVPDSKAKTLYIVTAFIGKSGYKKEASQLINADSLDATAKTEAESASNNSIPSDGENVNEKFSDRDPGNPEIGRLLEKENQKLKEDVSYLRELLKLQRKVTGGKLVRDSSVEAAARVLKKQLNASGDTAELAGLLKDFYSYIAAGKELTWDGVKEQAQGAAQWLMEHRKQERSDYAKDILSQIRGSRIYLDESQKAEAAHRFGSFNEFRKGLMGSITIANEANVSLDSFWQEMSSFYPDVFDAETASGDMPSQLADVIDRLKNSDTSMLEYEYNRAFTEQDIIRQIYDSYLSCPFYRKSASVAGCTHSFLESPPG